MTKQTDNIMLCRSAQMLETYIDRKLDESIQEGDVAQADLDQDALVPFYEELALIHRNRKAQSNG